MESVLQNPTLRRNLSTRQRQYLDTHDSEKPKVVKHEERLQKDVCRYLRLQYPSVIFRSDMSSGRWETGRYAKHLKVAMHSSKSWPDLFIYEPRAVAGKHYCGLALELKADGTPVIMKIGPRKGRLSSDPHIQEQAAMLKGLIRKGYYANFAVGLDEAIKTIDWYMGRPATAELF